MIDASLLGVSVPFDLFPPMTNGGEDGGGGGTLFGHIAGGRHQAVRGRPLHRRESLIITTLWLARYLREGGRWRRPSGGSAGRWTIGRSSTCSGAGGPQYGKPACVVPHWSHAMSVLTVLIC